MTTRLPHLASLALLAIAMLCPCSLLASDAFFGRSVLEALETLRADGLPLIYSSGLVPASLVVEFEPKATNPVDTAREILAPHGLVLSEREGIFVVVRSTDADKDSTSQQSPNPGLVAQPPPPPPETVVVSASRYVLQSASHFFVDQRAIQALPDLGEDPLRATHRLPGAAASGLSSKSHFRGGEHDETAIHLNGLQLLDPFHVRDYHSIFSSIDARAIAGVEAYTGGFPAPYGDHMSGILSLESQLAEEPRHTELGVSFYNTSALHRGHSADNKWDWLISGRDSNLDLVLKPSLGEPSYFDVFSQLGYRFSDSSYLTFNALYANDSVVVITESDPEELEQSNSDTRNRQFWFRLQNDWRPDLSSTTVLSYSSFENLRVAEMNDPDKMVARVRDDRSAEIWGLRQDWLWTAWENHELRFGLEYKDQGADYHYQGSAVYDGLLADLAGLNNPVAYAVEAFPDGYGASAYLADRWRMGQDTWVQFGLRWDRQTWTEPGNSDQLSPRVSLLHRIDNKTNLRLSWGRYSQSQAIQRLQVEDDIDQFFAPQRSDQFIVGYRREFNGGYRMRAEAFLKRYDRLKPRFENLFDPLALIPELAPDRVRLDPTGAESKGLEFSVEYRGEGEIEWWASYVLSRVTDRIDGRDQPRSWDQRHAVQAGISWQRGPWQFGAAINVHTGWPTTPLEVLYDPEEEEFIPVPGERNSDEFDTFFTMDLRLSRSFDVRKGSLSAFIEISNATNRDNTCCVDYDIDDDVQPPVIDRSPDFWVPIIPAIGILWEF